MFLENDNSGNYSAKTILNLPFTEPIRCRTFALCHGVMASSNRGVIASAAKQSSLRPLWIASSLHFSQRRDNFKFYPIFLHLKINVYLGHKKT